MIELNARHGVPGPILIHGDPAEHHPALRHLWHSFRHSMSEFSSELPDRHGTYRSERLDRALDPDRPDWGAWLLTAGDHPVGFALTRAMDQPVRVLSSFFLATPLRRRGLGRELARSVMTQAPGPWAVAFQDQNAPAAAFWRSLAASLDPTRRCERRTSARRPDLPPDTWLTFEVEDEHEAWHT